MLGKSAALTAILALPLALGIGVNSAIFSVLNGWLLRPLPVPAPEQIILKLVARQGLLLVVAGLAVGLIAAWALTRAMASLLIGIGATDSLTYPTGAILLSVVALAACWIPARRALRVDPMVALRYE